MSLPPAGWYPDPYGQAPLRFWDGTGWTPHAAGPPAGYGYGPPPRNIWRRLDERVAAMRAESPAPWGMRPILIPMLTFFAVVVAGGLLAALWSPSGQSRATVGLLLGVAGYAVLGAAIRYAGQPIARRHGGWAAAFGWTRPHAHDARPVVPWFLANIGARLIAGVIVALAVPAWRNASGSNVNLHGRSTGVIIATLIVVAVIAPPIEELWFRGLILRTLMRRLSFWPAAVAASLMFGLFHTYELDTLAGAAQLGISTAVFGLGQCMAVRRHVTLNAAIGVHALNNVVAALLTLVVLTHS